MRWLWRHVRPDYVWMVMSHKADRRETVIATFYNGYAAEDYCKELNALFKGRESGEWFSIHGIEPQDIGP